VLVGFLMGGGEVAGAKHVSHTAAKRQQGRLVASVVPFMLKTG
jgi:hypothetical protein